MHEYIDNSFCLNNAHLTLWLKCASEQENNSKPVLFSSIALIPPHTSPVLLFSYHEALK